MPLDTVAFALPDAQAPELPGAAEHLLQYGLSQGYRTEVVTPDWAGLKRARADLPDSATAVATDALSALWFGERLNAALFAADPYSELRARFATDDAALGTYYCALHAALFRIEFIKMFRRADKIAAAAVLSHSADKARGGL